VHRICTTLASLGAIDKVDTGFQLGPLLFRLGQRVPVRRSLRDAALPFMEDLYVAVRETIHLALLDDREAYYLERIAGRRSDAVPSQVGGRVPLHCTATGKCLLAFGDPQLLRAIAAAPLERKTRYTVVDPQMIEASLQVIRRDGFAVEREEHRLGYGSVAAPIVDADEQMVAAMSITTRIAQLDVERFAPSLRAATLGVGRHLREPPVGRGIPLR
jgi:DNA-binding IclR family transcriptional regulator